MTNEILHEETIDVTPVPARVHLKTIVVQPGSWEEHVGALGECTEVYRTGPQFKDGVSKKRLGIVFFYGGRWAIAVDGHEVYEGAPARGDKTREELIWFLDIAHQIVRDDSPKTAWRAA